MNVKDSCCHLFPGKYYQLNLACNDNVYKMYDGNSYKRKENKKKVFVYVKADTQV